MVYPGDFVPSGECDGIQLVLSEICVSLFQTTGNELGEPKKAARAMYQ